MLEDGINHLSLRNQRTMTPLLLGYPDKPSRVSYH